VRPQSRTITILKEIVGILEAALASLAAVPSLLRMWGLRVGARHRTLPVITTLRGVSRPFAAFS